MGTPAAATPPAAAPQMDFDTAAVDQAMGQKGKNNGGIYQFSIPRAEPIKDNGMEIPEAMGSAIGINFQPTGSGKAAITGDFVLLSAITVGANLRWRVVVNDGATLSTV